MDIENTIDIKKVLEKRILDSKVEITDRWNIVNAIKIQEYVDMEVGTIIWRRDANKDINEGEVIRHYTCGHWAWVRIEAVIKIGEEMESSFPIGTLVCELNLLSL